jgi:putative ABC transport system substrate-binding protein
VSVGGLSIDQLLQATHSVPIVFTIVLDPVGLGLVASMSRPGGNATGFMMFEYSLAGKWPELLKQIAPDATRAAVLRETTPTGIGQFAVIQSAAPTVGVEVIPIGLRDAAELQRAIAVFAQSPNGGLIVTASTLALVNRDLIVKFAARHKLPAVYSERSYVAGGGLISYGPNYLDPVSARRRLRRSHPQGREAGRFTGAGADQVRTDDQPQDREGARA